MKQPTTVLEESPMPTLDDLEKKYFPEALPPGVPNWDKTMVIPHVDGEAFFSAIADALDLCQGDGDRIYIASWLFNPDMPLRKAAGSPLFKELLLDKAARSVDVRVIVGTGRFSFGPSAANPWKVEYWVGALAGRFLGRVVSPNIRAVLALRSARSGGAKPLNDRILMDWGGHADSRHEKTTIVYIAAINELRAFVGGLDYRIDRMASELHESGFWHDVGVELRAGAAAAVLANFVDRWEEARTLPPQQYRLDDSSDRFNPNIIATPPTLPSQPPGPLPVVPDPGQYLGASVRSLRSYWTFRAFSPWINEPNLAWKRLPSTGIREVLLVLQQAITAASSYIYVEDQTLNPDPVYRQYGSHDLLYPTIRAACAKGVKVMFVTDGFAGSDSPRQANLTMSSEINDLILSPLTADQRTNFTLHVVTGTKVHSKVVLIDDEFALIGSANFWDRSMTGVESEVSAAIVHPGRNASLVADLRVRLWCGHLRVAPTSPGVEADLRDLRKSLGVFRKSWGTDVGFPHHHSALKEIVP